jgi:hypothetical protein
MNDFYAEENRIYYKRNILPANIVCDILNDLEKNSFKPSQYIDFIEYECEYCHRKENGHNGSWNQTPYLFFCSGKCHKLYLEKEAADKEELNYCPVCGKNKLAYSGRADSYWCYECQMWYEWNDLYWE